MGKIKSKPVRRAANTLLKQGLSFTDTFQNNKKLLGSNTMPSKKIRNQLAGLLSRIKKVQKINEAKLSESLNK